MQLNGKYTIKKKNETIQTKNNLTIFGALQIARLFKRNIVFPKNAKSFGCNLSYDGEYTKLSVKEANGVTFPFGNTKINVSGEKLNTTYIYDDNLNTSTTFTFDAGYNQNVYFDLQLKNSMNIGKIGIMAKINGDGNYVGSSQSYYSLADWTILFKPEGINIEFVKTNQNAMPIKTTILSGDYIRVYNPNMPTINNKPYYIMNKLIMRDGNTICQRLFFCLYYCNRTNKWRIRNVTLSYQTESSNNFKTLSDDFVLSQYSISHLQDEYIDDGSETYSQYTGQYQFETDNLNDNYQQQWKTGDTNIDTVGNVTITMNIGKWIRPCYKLHTYMNNFYNGYAGSSASPTIMSSFSNSDVYQSFRWMQMIPDNNANYQGKGTLNYNKGNSSFDQYLCYNTYSFESLQGFNALYNYDQNEKTADFCRQHMVGFIPYVKTVRFVKKTAYGDYRNRSANFYGIDIYQKNSTPYNPIKIALTQSNQFNQSNSWFVDTIQQKGDNSVVFTKTLAAQEGITSGTGFKKIGLFGNLDGHLQATLPKDVIIKKSNCFSQATFANRWIKTSDQQVVVTYQLSIGD